MRTGNSPPSGGKLRLLSITHSGRRRSGNARAAKQAKVARRGKIHERKSAARRQRKAAFKTARGPYRWPEWSLVAGAAAFIAWIVLVAISRGTLNWAGTTAVPMFLIWLFAALIAGPAVLWRRHRARQAAAAMLAAANQAEHREPPLQP